jgi:hypothetical protein
MASSGRSHGQIIRSCQIQNQYDPFFPAIIKGPVHFGIVKTQETTLFVGFDTSIDPGPTETAGWYHEWQMTSNDMIGEIGPSSVCLQGRFGVQPRKERRTENRTQVPFQELNGLWDKGAGLLDPFFLVGVIGGKTVTEWKDGPSGMKVLRLWIILIVVIVIVVIIIIVAGNGFGIVLFFGPCSPSRDAQGFVSNNLPVIYKRFPQGVYVFFDRRDIGRSCHATVWDFDGA